MRRTRSGLYVEDGVRLPGPPMAGRAPGWAFGREVGKVSGTSATSQAVTLSAGASVPLGNVVVVWGENNGGTINANGISDSKANTWNLEVNLQTGGVKGLVLAWCVLTNTWTNTDTITSNCSSTGSLIQTLYVADFTPPAGTVSRDAVQTGSSTSASSFSSGTIADVGADDLLIGALTEAGTSAASVTPNVQTPTWTATPTANQNTSGNILFQWYGLDAAAGSYSLNGTLSAASNYVAAILALNASLPAAIPISTRQAKMTAQRV